MPEEYNQQLSDAVRRVLRENGDGFRPLTFAEAAKRSGVSSTMIHSMLRGKRVGCEGIIRFAHAFGEDVKAWLKMADYPDIAALMSGERPPPPPQVYAELDALLETLPADKRDLAREDVKQLIRGYIVPRYRQRYHEHQTQAA